MIEQEILIINKFRVSKTQIITWANDAFENGEIDAAPKNLEHAMHMLVDAGLIWG